MSADNYGVVAKHPVSGRWHVLMGFASVDEFEPSISDDGHREQEDALAEARDCYFEYGWSMGEWPETWFEYCDHCGGFAKRFIDKEGVVRDAIDREVER